MALAFQPEDTVTIKNTTLSGTVKGMAIVDNDVQFKVSYTDNSGVDQERYFTESELNNANT